MASIVLSDFCGFRPLPSATRFRPKTQSPEAPHLSSVSAGVRPILAGRLLREWALKVSAPAMPLVAEQEEGEDAIVARKEEFDPGMPPPFGLAEIRAAIPNRCWVKDPWRSMSYVARDVAVVLGLAAAAARVSSWIVWPLYWAAQGTMFWALFVLGHDWYGDAFAQRFNFFRSLFSSFVRLGFYRLVSKGERGGLDSGHGSFSNSAKLNSVVGHILHSSILVPYHGW